MPGSQHGPSIKNPRVYDALRRRGYSKRRAAAISNAQRHKDSGTTNMAVPPHGPDALFNQPSMAQRRRKKRMKAFNWGAHVGQAISGRLTRGEGGRFSGSGQATTAKPPSKSHERRTALREARQQRMDAIHAARAAEQEQEQAKRAEEDAYIAAGENGHQRQQRRAEIASARRERAAARTAAHQKQIEDERAKRAEEDAAPSDEGDAATEPKKGGGGGGGKKKPSDAEKLAERDRKRAANRTTTAPKAGLSTAEADWLASVASGTPPAGSFDGRHLAELGLTQDAGDTTEATDAGRRAVAALERGDVRGALAAIQDGKAKVARDRAKAEKKRQPAKRRSQRSPTGPVRQTMKAQSTFGGTKRSDLADNVFAGPDRSFPIKTAQDVRDAVRSLGRTKHDKAAVKRGIIRRARAIGAVDALPESWREKSFAVFKDAAGRARWAAITTTAYQDKDSEWIGTKAIRGVVAAGDAGAPRGPLRFWHVPGLDLGDCDYQATAFGDRFLLESGTFRGPTAARIGQKAAARGYQMSPGFLHTRREPLGGLYEHIALFERSFVPPGRAANPGTSFITKGDRMLTDEKKKEFEALAGDEEGRALLEGLLAQAATTVKANDGAGAVYKDAPPWAQALVTRLDGLEERLKAFPPKAAPAAAMDPEDDPALGGDSGVDEGAEGEPPLDTGGGADGMDDQAFAAMLADAVAAKLGPMLDLEKKLVGYLNEMKGMVQPATKDDERARQLGALDARLKELEGGQPRSLASGVWGQLSGTPVTKEQATQLAAKPAGAVPAGISDPVEVDAYRLIFGE